MGKSGLATILLLALAAVVVLVAVARSNTELAAAWGDLVHPVPDTVLVAPVAPPTNPRAMSAGDGANQVRQMQRDMEAQQELSRSVGR